MSERGRRLSGRRQVVVLVPERGDVEDHARGVLVSLTVRQRQQFIRKVRGLTAMGRAGSYVLMGLPFVIAGAITAMNSDYMSPLYHSSAGHKLMALGFTMMAIGSLMLKKIVSFKG